MRRTGPAAAAAIIISIVACGGGSASIAPTASMPAASQEASLDPRPSTTLSPTAAPTASPSPELLTAADDVTMIVSNRYPYRIWIPRDWDTGEMGQADAFQGPAGQQVDVRYYPAISDGPDAWFAKANDVLEGFAPIDLEAPATHAAGNGRWYGLHPMANGREVALYRLVILSGKDAWDITWVSPAGNETTDQLLFQSIANTFWPTSEPLNVWSLGVGDCFQSLPISQPGRAGTASVFLGPVDGFAGSTAPRRTQARSSPAARPRDGVRRVVPAVRRSVPRRFGVRPPEVRAVARDRTPCRECRPLRRRQTQSGNLDGKRRGQRPVRIRHH